MIAAMSNNSMLSALFGPGVARGQRVNQAQADHRSVDASGGLETSDQTQSIDVVEISDAGKAAAKVGQTVVTSGQAAATNNPLTDENSKPRLGGQEELSHEEQQQVKELKQRDQEVRRHEQAHKAAAGQYATGGATFEYETGPDGKRYAVGGEVSISTSEIAGNPEATIQKMQQIRRAALAPGHPSGQDRSVAAQAQSAERAARTELADQRREEMSGVGQGESAANLKSSQNSESVNDTHLGNASGRGGASIHAVIGTQSNIGVAGGDLLDVIA